ncbi:hypothetical protein LY11_04373 [Pedobacter cryoconitis]|uniref:Uncharacterized protein n=1 Tax=Pedobacter cryoconitis TaxID=188932 RepID=A0A327S8I6_9SPHI|nr:hypothetical protein LY11_04373 [Pedobacter cryoconitis]
MNIIRLIIYKKFLCLLSNTKDMKDNTITALLGFFYIGVWVFITLGVLYCS